MPGPDGEFLREYGAARTRATERDGSADELMRLAGDPLLLASVLRRREAPGVWLPETTKVPLPGLALPGSTGKAVPHRNSYQTIEALRPPSLVPEIFDPADENWGKTLDLLPPARHPSSASSGNALWGIAITTAMLVLGSLFLRW